MSARSFRSVFMVASCAGAALGCYLVSLRVASERAALEEVETQIVMAERDIRLLGTEIGTRGRLAQLERWNVRVLALSAPSADQFVEGGFALASMVAPQRKIAIEAPVVLASAPAEAPRPQVPGTADQQVAGADSSATADQLLHVASLKRSTREEIQTAAVEKASGPAKSTSADKAADSGAEPGTKTARTRQAVEKKAGDKPVKAASKPVTKTVRTAKVDPLAPLPAASSKAGKDPNSAR